MRASRRDGPHRGDAVVISKQWRVESPSNAKALEETLNRVQREGWEVFEVMKGGGGGNFTVVCYKETAQAA